LNSSSFLNLYNNLPDDGKRKKAVVQQRYFHALASICGGFEKIKAAALSIFQQLKAWRPIGGCRHAILLLP